MTIITVRETVADACPICGAELGRGRGATRRQIVFCATPGVFRWRCPDCSGIWQVRRSNPRLE
jgi:transposase-like protein